MKFDVAAVTVNAGPADGKPATAAKAPAAPAALPAPAARIRVEISPGELLDRLSILSIKSERITDPCALRNVMLERAALEELRSEVVPRSAAVQTLERELRAVNDALWLGEDDVRACESRGDFGPPFVQAARSLYRLNDRRAAIKRQVNLLLGARVIEEKLYVNYS